MEEGQRSGLSEEVEARARRKIKAQKHSGHSFWMGVGMFGLIGWSVSVPTLLGTGLGYWLDKYHPTDHSWTLSLLVAGLLIGCANAWYWVKKEAKNIEKESDDE